MILSLRQPGLHLGNLAHIHIRSASVQPLVMGLTLFGIGYAVFSSILFATPNFLGIDDYYHSQIAHQIGVQGRLALDFQALPLTILNPDVFVDHHLLYHLYLLPFTFSEGLMGVKIAQALVASGVLVVLWGLLRTLEVHYAATWSLLLLGLSSPFLYRMLMIRTQGMSLLFLLLVLLVIFQKRDRWLLPLAFGYVWLYDGFVILPVIVFIYTVAEWIIEREFIWRPLLYTFIGIWLGLVLNPYFPVNIHFVVEHLGAKVSFESGIDVGAEWYPYTTGDLMEHSLGALLVLGLGFLRPSFGGYKRDVPRTTLLLIALLTLFMLFKSKRFIEYYPAFALLFFAASWGRGDLQAVIHRLFPKRLFWLMMLILIGVGGFFVVSTMNQTWRDTGGAAERTYMAEASAWIRENVPIGVRIFQTDWDDFTRLYYHNPDYSYIVGLDPTYLQYADQGLWDTWVAITHGKISQPSAVITEQFEARYVVSDARHQAFMDSTRDDARMELVYMDDHSYIWHIRPE